MAQLALGAVGAVAGFFIGGPTGALIGFNVGASLGASLSDTTVQGNRIGDIAKQTSKEGVARPIVWGRVRPIGGNLIACSEPKIVKVKHKSGGKGGGGSTTTVTESVYRTYAIRVCEGPITKYVRIWRNNELVYDARGNDWGAENNPEFLKTARLYTGAWEQMPDSALEGIFGAGDVPAHRGTAYMVMVNELLNDTGGAVPQWTFEVERAEGIYLTSRPYALEYSESSSVQHESIKPEPVASINDSVSILNQSIISASLISLIVDYQYDDNVTASPSIISAQLTSVITMVPYSTEIESVSISGGIVSTSLVNVVITYSTEIESVSISGGIVSGYLN